MQSELNLVVDGLRVRYWTNGILKDKGEPVVQKPTIVLFHGYSFSIDTWKETGTLDHLTKCGYPTYAVDLPSGKTTKSDKVDYERMESYVPIVEKIFSKLMIGSSLHPIVIIGPSMGGGFAVAYSIVHPGSVAALVLVSPALRTIDESQFQKLKMPIMLVWGERDNLFPLEEYGRPLKEKFPHSKLLIIKDAGHAAYLDKPQEFNELLVDFLEELT